MSVVTLPQAAGNEVVATSQNQQQQVIPPLPINNQSSTNTTINNNKMTQQQQQPIVVTTSARTKYVLSSTLAQPQLKYVPGSLNPKTNTNSNNSTPRKTSSSSRTPKKSPRRLLDRNDLRSIRNYVSTNRMRPHQFRTGKINDVVPDSPFEELQERPLDDSVALTLAPINENESALDVPLRFAAPVNLHAPAAVDSSRGQALGTRLLGTLKGAAGLQPHWDGEKSGTEKDYAHVVMVKDASMKAEAARRSGDLRRFSSAEHVLGVLYYNSEINEKAVTFFRAAAELAHRAEDNQWRALNENLATCCLMKLHRWREAASMTLETAQYCGPYGKSVCFNNAGVCNSAVKDYASAKQCFEAALRNATSCEDNVLDTISRGNLACSQLRLGELPDAQANFERCLEVCSVAGDSVGSSVILILLGETVGAAGDFKRSVFFFEQALRIANEAKCFELAKVAQTSIGITKAINVVQSKITSSTEGGANAAVTSKEILATLK